MLGSESKKSGTISNELVPVAWDLPAFGAECPKSQEPLMLRQTGAVGQLHSSHQKPVVTRPHSDLCCPYKGGTFDLFSTVGWHCKYVE